MSEKKKILIIEDDIYVRDVYVEMLKEAGYDVDVASDGLEGIVKAEKGGYDLILIDILMPRLDGIEVLKQLHTHPSKLRNKVIVVLTNLAQENLKEETAALGAKGYIIKSELNPQEFLQKIQTFL